MRNVLAALEVLQGRGLGPGPESSSYFVQVVRAGRLQLAHKVFLVVSAKAHGPRNDSGVLFGDRPVEVGGELAFGRRPLLAALHEDKPALGLDVLVQKTGPSEFVEEQGGPVFDHRQVGDSDGFRVRKIGGPCGPLG